MQKIRRKPFYLGKKPFNSKIVREWVGEFSVEHIFLNTYIVEKYKKKLHFLPFTCIYIEIGKDSDPEPMIIDCNASLFVSDISKNKANNCIEYLFSKTKKITLYKTLYKNTDKRFVFYPITLVNKDTDSGHSMFFLYDRVFNEVIFFDNVGYDMGVFKKYFKKFFQDIHGKDVRIDYNISIFCYDMGGLVADRCHTGYNYFSKGYCVIFTLWFLEVRLKNTNNNLNIDDIMSRLNHTMDIGSPEKICKIIIGYAQFIHKITDAYELRYTDNDFVIRVSKKKMSDSKYHDKTLSVLGSVVASGNSYKLKYKN